MMRLSIAFALCCFPISAWAAPTYSVKLLSAVAVYPESRAVAQVVPNNESRLAVEVSARIEHIPARIGQSVRKGDVLVKLDARQYKLAADQAAAQVELLQNRYKLAELQFEQAKSLHASQYVSAQVLEQRRTELAVIGSELKIARHALAQARLSLDKTTLRAPFAGAVKDRLVGEGELASPGQPVLVLSEAARTELRARVSNSDIAALKAAPTLSVRLDGQMVPVTIVRIAPIVDARAQTRDVVLQTQAPLLSGSSGELLWSSTTPHLPAAYLQQRQGQYGAWIEEGGKPMFKPLTDAQAGRPVPVNWPLSTRIIDEGRFALAAPASASAAPAK